MNKIFKVQKNCFHWFFAAFLAVFVGGNSAGQFLGLA